MVHTRLGKRYYVFLCTLDHPEDRYLIAETRWRIQAYVWLAIPVMGTCWFKWMTIEHGRFLPYRSQLIVRNGCNAFVLDVLCIWMTATLSNFAGHFKFQPTDVRTWRLVFSFVKRIMFKNCTKYPLFRGFNVWSIGFRFWHELFVNYFVFGSIPPRFEEGYETHVNVCSLLLRFDSSGIC